MASVAAVVAVSAVAFKVAPLLVMSITKSAKKIQQVSKQTSGNRRLCEQLSLRIDTIVNILQEQHFDETMSRALKIALVRFAAFLLECFEFIVQFNDASRVKRLWNTKDNYEHFNQLNNEFSHHLQGLQTGLSLMNRSNNKHDNDHSQQESLVDMQDKQKQLDECKSMLIMPVQTPRMNYAKDMKDQKQERDIFEGSVWKYERWTVNNEHDSWHCELTFIPASKRLRGSGEDRLGRFRIEGSFSEQTQIMKMIWSYRDQQLRPTYQHLIQLQLDTNELVLHGIFSQKDTRADETYEPMGYFNMSKFCPLSS